MYPRRTEIDLRQELGNMFDGVFPEIAKSRSFVLRKMRRTSSGDLIVCDCVSPLTHEPDKDTLCTVCGGEGFLWNEFFIDAYKVEIKSDVGNALRERQISQGVINPPVANIYLKSSVQITKEDKIVEMETDSEGNLTRPYTRKYLYRIGSLVDLRSDNGRLEFYKVNCYVEERKFLNGNI